uniref:Retrotransposon gag domain-containing protein n=1 Tax=Oryza brachyantha TaxID=4533 RepID=J3ME20_ORYBR
MEGGESCGDGDGATTTRRWAIGAGSAVGKEEGKGRGLYSPVVEDGDDDRHDVGWRPMAMIGDGDGVERRRRSGAVARGGRRRGEEGQRRLEQANGSEQQQGGFMGGGQRVGRGWLAVATCGSWTAVVGLLAAGCACGSGEIGDGSCAGGYTARHGRGDEPRQGSNQSLENLPNLQDMVDLAVHHALINLSGVLEWFERVPLPHRYIVSDFSKFSGQDRISTIEHVSGFLAYCGEASAEDAFTMHFFPMPLSGSTFTWFSSLPPNLVRNWADLEKQFHKYFFARVQQMTLTDLTTVRQRLDELEKHIQLPTGHVISSAEEMKKKRYCKWHNFVSHHTNDCHIFQQQIQSAVEQGRIKLDEAKKLIKIDGHPFLVNMVHANIGYRQSRSSRKHEGTIGAEKEAKNAMSGPATMTTGIVPSSSTAGRRIRLPSREDCPDCNLEEWHETSRCSRLRRPRTPPREPRHRILAHDRLGL